MIPIALMLAMMAPASDCKVSQMAELPVTMVGQRAMVEAKFGDRAAPFILDSGAFYSTISAGAAAEYGLKVKPAPAWFRLSGIGGDSTAGIAQASNYSLVGVAIPKIEFLVGGSDTGKAGLLGQNILGLGDVEYDLPHGVVRLFKTTDCNRMSLAYWAKSKPVTSVPLEGRALGLLKPHTIAMVTIDGVKVRALFDTGAESGVMSLQAAKRIGVTPKSNGAIDVDTTSGIGSKRIPAWLFQFKSIDMGGEIIRNPRFRIAPIDLGGDADMLIGIDFFLTHRVFVSNATHSMYFTYEGGPLFGLTPKGASTASGEKIDLNDHEAAPKSAEEFSRRGAAFASNHKSAEALADFDKAIALAPGEGRYIYQRAMLKLDMRRPQEARADLDKALELSPGNMDARMARAELLVDDDTPDLAAADVAALESGLAPSSAIRLQLGGLEGEMGRYDAAIANFDLWLKFHAQDSKRPDALNGRCWVRGMANRELGKALDDCNAALRIQPGDLNYLDSRAYVRMRRGELALAIADYDAVIRLNPKGAFPLYARGIAEAKLGKAEAAKADRDAALAINPQVAKRARRLGLE